MKGDLIYKVSNTSHVAHLDPGGMWYNDALCSKQFVGFLSAYKIGDTLTFSVLRKTASGGSASLDMSVEHVLPTKEELPLVRKYHMYSDEGGAWSKSFAMHGDYVETVDLDDVNKYQMVDYYRPEKRFERVLMVEAVDTRSPA